MTEREIENKLKSLFDQLRLIDKYEEDFLRVEGRRGLQKRIDAILDEINRFTNLKNLK